MSEGLIWYKHPFESRAFSFRLLYFSTQYQFVLNFEMGANLSESVKLQLKKLKKHPTFRSLLSLLAALFLQGLTLVLSFVLQAFQEKSDYW
jgi:hypothetical protein